MRLTAEASLPPMTKTATLLMTLALVAGSASARGTCAPELFLPDDDPSLWGRTFGGDCYSVIDNAPLPNPVTGSGGTLQALAYDLYEQGVEVSDEQAQAVHDALHRAVTFAAELGSDVSVGRHVRVVLTDQSGASSTTNGESDVRNNRCYIAISPHGHGRGSIELSRIVAHELFHCIQDQTFGTAYWEDATGEDDDPLSWYLEGGANWFAFSAIPNVPLDEGNAAHNWLLWFEFRHRHLDIRKMDYGAWPVFAWHAEAYGARATMDYLRRLDGHGDSVASILDTLEDQDWLDFATRYSAFHIRLPDGRRVLPSRRDSRPTTHIREDKEESFVRKFGRLARSGFVLGPGQWRLTLPEGGDGFVSGVLENGDPDGLWIPLDGPLTLETVCGETEPFVLVGYGIDPDEVPLKVRFEKAGDSCIRSCDHLPDGLDPCLLGRWQDVNFVAPDHAMAASVELLAVDQPPPVWTFFDNRGFRSDQPFHMDMIEREGDQWVRTVTSYSVNAGLGFWGTGDGKLYVCEERDVSRGKMTRTSSAGRGGSGPLDTDKDLVAEGQERNMTFDYTCQDDTLTIRNPSQGLVRGEFRRVGAAPEVPEDTLGAPDGLLPMPRPGGDHGD